MTKKRILLAYAVPRSGHAQAAHALLEAFMADPECDAKEFNMLEWRPTLVKFFPFLYRLMIRRSPRSWKHFHGNRSYGPVMKLLRNVAVATGLFGFERARRKYDPDAVIATHFLHTQILGEARLRKTLGVPVYALPTDYGAHPFWAHPGIDWYFAASDAAKEDLIREGIDPKRIEVTGIPVKQELLDRPSRESAMKTLGLDPTKKCILIMGGSYGFFPFAEFVREILAWDGSEAYTWLMLFGSDTASYDRVRRMIPSSRKGSIQMFTYLPQITPFFSAAHLAISKPGGIFTSEALACDLPMVIHRPLPGQEDMNAKFLTDNRAAVRANSPKEAIKLADEVLRHEETYQGYLRAVRKIAKPNAAKDIVARVKILTSSTSV